jgi:predicted RNA-binding protein YlxR (DUF448 family)
MGVPMRRCVGCGRSAPQHDLLRFGARDGVLVPGNGSQGRGAYTCRRLACFEQARSERGFARTLRQRVQVDPTLTRLYTDEEANG